MSTKKVTLVTINSLTTISKVHSSPVSLISGKGLSLVRNLSIGSERLDLRNANSSNGENCTDYQQNPNGYCSDIPNHVDLQPKSDNGYSQQSPYRGNQGSFYQTPNTKYQGESLGGGFNQNPSVHLGQYSNNKNVMLRPESNRIGFEGNQSDQNKNNFGGRHGEFQQNSMGGDVKFNSNNVWQHQNNGYGNNFSGSNDGNHWNNQSSAGNYNGSIGVAQQSSYNYGQRSAITYQQGISNPSVRTPNQYNVQNIGDGGQSPIWNQNAISGHYPNSSDVSAGGTMSPPLLDNSETVAEGYRGTIKELDDVCKEGKMEEVVKVLELLAKNQIPVDLSRYFMLMNACGEAEAIKEAKIIHEHLMKSSHGFEIKTCNKILEMYGKCGSMDDAVTVFNKMPDRNLTSWDTMISYFAKNDQGELAIDMFTQFKQSGIKPDGQMFIGVFRACGLVGDVIEGKIHFQSMSNDFGIIPTMEHYVSVVDMMGTAGYLDEALEFMEKMPVEPSVEVWETMMNLSRVYGHAELGDRCMEIIELMDPTRLHNQSKEGLIPVKASDLAKEKDKKKFAAGNLLAVRSRVHEYRAADKSHPESERIYTLLRGMKEQMKEAGYVAETRFVLHDIDQESKEEALLAHSERLAVAYGLMTSPARADMRIIKNLRVCGDCHSALKIISKLVGRQLVIRDAKRFHHFKDGLCSCKDYW